MKQCLLFISIASYLVLLSSAEITQQDTTESLTISDFVKSLSLTPKDPQDLYDKNPLLLRTFNSILNVIQGIPNVATNTNTTDNEDADQDSPGFTDIWEMLFAVNEAAEQSWKSKMQKKRQNIFEWPL